MAKVAAAGSPKGGSPGRRLVNAEIGAGTGAGRCEGYAQHAPRVPLDACGIDHLSLGAISGSLSFTNARPATGPGPRLISY